MFGRFTTGNRVKILSTLVGTLLLAGIVHAARQAVPDTFNNYLVFMANGSVPIGVPHPEVPGCELDGFIFCDGQWFQENIMDRTQEEIDAEIAKAKMYLLTRFGLDADDPANIGRLVFFSFMIDPRVNYRAYTAADLKVPGEGWVVRDGGFGIQVIDPNGFELGGDLMGQTAPQGALAIYGNYNIQVTKPNGSPSDTIVIGYRSDTPMINNEWGELVINCQISDNSFADGTNNGKAQGIKGVGDKTQSFSFVTDPFSLKNQNGQ